MRRDGAEWELRFKQGQPVGALKKIGPARGTGTTVFFHPDSTIFPRVEFDADIIKARLEVSSYLHNGGSPQTLRSRPRRFEASTCGIASVGRIHGRGPR